MNYPHYPIPWPLVLRLAAAVLRLRPRSFTADARLCVEGLQPPMQVIGPENIPASGPCLLTINHYISPGFRSWWLTLSVSAAVRLPVHWVMTSAWTYADPLRSRLLTPPTRWLFRRVAQVYGFTNMPPMPPVPKEAAARAQAVRRVLTYARASPCPVVGLAPEGRDAPGGKLHLPPPGVGRFVLQLARLGLKVTPVGIFEDGPQLCLRFGPAYRLEMPPGLPLDERDRRASQIVMAQIAAQLPSHLLGE